MTRPASGAAPPHEQLLLLEYSAALARLAGKQVTIEMLTPGYACIGSGRLRVVRAEEDASGVRLVLSYDDYERIK